MEQEEFLLSQELGFFNSVNWNNLPDEWGHSWCISERR